MIHVSSTHSYSVQTLQQADLHGTRGRFTVPAELERRTENIRHMPRLTEAWVAQSQVAGLKKDPKVQDTSVAYKETEGELFGRKGPAIGDIRQGGLGDCFFLAAVGAIVADDPSAIKNSIRDNKDGTYSVRFFKSNGNAVWVTVDNDLPVDKNGNLAYAKGVDSDGDGKLELWVPIMEKAYAAFKDKYGPKDGVDGYKDIGRGGSPGDAIQTLTGKSCRYVSMPHASSELADLLCAANNGTEVVISTKDNANQGWVGWHAYTVLGTYEKDGETMVRVRNPWGFVEPDEAIKDGSNDGLFDIRLKDLEDQIKGVHTDEPHTILQDISDFFHRIFA